MLKYKIESIRWHFFAYNFIGKKISNWCRINYTKHQKNWFAIKMMQATLPF